MNITPYMNSEIRLFRTNNTGPFDFDITGVDCNGTCYNVTLYSGHMSISIRLIVLYLTCV